MNSDFYELCFYSYFNIYINIQRKRGALNKDTRLTGTITTYVDLML